MSQLEYDEIQGVVLSSYNHLPNAAYLFLKMGDPGPARSWLAALVPQITSARPYEKDAQGKRVKPAQTLNLAFTNSGLTRLGISTEGFSAEFREGIAGPYVDNGKPPVRSRRLGDINASDPATWEFGGYKNPVDVLLMLFAADQNSLDDLCRQHQTAFEQQGLTLVARQDCYRPDHGREPFGFRDGMSQPVVEGGYNQDQASPGEPVVKAGEFILGYPNQYGLISPTPPISQLGKNSTYIVYRKLEQDVAGFWNYMYRQVSEDAERAVWLAAKMIGRWPSGAPLTLSPEKDDPSLGDHNGFLFADTDKAGYGCPVGSHIRRANPRDALQPGPVESMDSVQHHRLLRRGRVYGPAYDADVPGHLTQVQQERGINYFEDDSPASKGLSLVAINTDLKRQFEFIQQTWLNDPKFDGLSDNRDPLVGNNEQDKDQSYLMTIQRHPVHKQVSNLPSFVRVRAGEYFFVPSMTGLKYLAATN